MEKDRGIIITNVDDKKQCDIHGVIDSATLIKQQLELIDQKILVQIVYESGFWCYVLHRLPSDEDIKFSESGECQDGDLWKRAEQLNNDWWEQEQESFLEALTNGIKDAKHYLQR
jgi:hypothetical protein